MRTCKFCKIDMKENLFHADYISCPKCKFSIRIKNFITQNYMNYKNIYNINRFNNELNNDRNHYLRMLNQNLLPTNISFEKVVALGGGFPKMEVFLNTKNIVIYDLVADFYKNNFNFFENIYLEAKNKNIKYENALINDESINTIVDYEVADNDNILFTFVHILEHYPCSDFEKVINTFIEKIKSIKNKKIYVYIYQPDAAKARKGWFHFNALDHLCLIPFDMFKTYLKDLQIIKSLQYNDDMLFFCKN